MQKVAGILGCTAIFAVALNSCGTEHSHWTEGADTTLTQAAKLNDDEVLLMSLGASTSAGYTFDPTLLGIDAPAIYADNDHIARLAALVSSQTGSEVDVYNLAVPGSTTTEIIADQLEDAVEEVARYTRGAVVTVEGGGNDLRAFQVDYIDYCLNPEPMAQYICGTQLMATLVQIDNNLRTIVTALQEAAPSATIVLQTQYNSLYGELPGGVPCADASLLAIANAAMEGNPAENGAPFLGLNPRIRAIAAEYDLKVADISGFLFNMPGELYKDPSYFSNDCTHLAGTRDAVDTMGMPENTVGAGYELLLTSYAYALGAF